MSIFSDYAVGVLSDEEYERECTRMNRRDRMDRDEDEYDIDKEWEQLDGIEREELMHLYDDDSEGGLIADD